MRSGQHDVTASELTGIVRWSTKSRAWEITILDPSAAEGSHLRYPTHRIFEAGGLLKRLRAANMPSQISLADNRLVLRGQAGAIDLLMALLRRFFGSYEGRNVVWTYRQDPS